MSSHIRKAKELRKKLGGKIFAFPIEEDNPFSKYAVIVYEGGMFHEFQIADDISYAALGVRTILEQGKRSYNYHYDRDVRLISYEAQVNAPSIPMRKMRNNPELYFKKKENSSL